MAHIEPDELAVLALEGQEPDAAVRDHLDGCAECLAEYEAYAHTAALGRGGVPEHGDDLPSSAVWAGIHSELGLAPALVADPLSGEVRTAPSPEAAAPTSASAPAPTPAPPPAPTPRRGGGSGAKWWTFALAAAVVGILAGVAIGFGIARTGSPPPQTVLARAALEPFPGWDASGEALVEEDPDGSRTIVVDLDAPVPSGSVREVWLIRSDASGLVSLGLLDGTSGRFVVPSDVDLGEFPIVDVSAEPLDGEPAHSGDSIVRGELHEDET